MGAAWTTATIDGKPVDLFELEAQPRAALVFLHAYDLKSLRDSSLYTRLLAEHRLACICPAGGYFWWADRPCAEFHSSKTPEAWLLDTLVPFTRAHWQLGERSLGVFGFSMGGQAALRLAFKHPEQFPAVAAVAPAIECHELHGQGTPLDDLYDSKEQCRQDTAPMHIQQGHAPPHLFFACDPGDDFWFRGSDRLHEKLVALGIEHECDLTTRAGGHAWRYFDSMAERVMQFLGAGLQRQSLRLM